ncbi:MAG: FecR protein, partial [Candidatus Hydrogenedentes bacterium]|nr:FecR protein [Candidatus Hydrogenedentota bacterium]
MMNTKRNSTVLLLAVAVFTAAPALAQEVMHARISFDAGGAMVRGTADDDWSYATINTIVLPGDTLWSDKGGTIELEMAGGSFLRMADGSKAEIVALPPAGHVRGWTGAFYVQRISRSTGGMVFESPACSIDVAPDTQVRLDVVGEGSTTVSVRWGQATVRTPSGESTPVGVGQRIFVDPGLLPSAPMPFDRTAEDAFDTLNREPARLLAEGPDVPVTPVKIPETVIGVSDLNRYGTWVYVDNTPYWHPTVVVDYVPYRSGYWSYTPVYGNVWVGSYPFCYVTSHYGRWTYSTNYGWMWGYTDTWGPAWVASVRYGPNFMWTPLDPWDRPVFCNGYSYSSGSMQFSLMASTYCPADAYLTYGYCPVYPVTQTIVQNVPATQVHIWNINVHTDSHDDHGYRPPSRGRDTSPGDSPMEVRNYTPNRVIRGPSDYESGGRAASTRIATLEKTDGRPEFAPVRSDSPRGVRTPMAETQRTARMRSVQVDPAAMASANRIGAVNMTNSRNGGRDTAKDTLPSRSVRTMSSARPEVPKATDSPRASARSTQTPPRPDAATPPTDSRRSSTYRTPGETRSSRTPESSVDKTPEPSAMCPQISRPPAGYDSSSRSSRTQTRTPEVTEAPSAHESSPRHTPMQPQIRTRSYTAPAPKTEAPMTPAPAPTETPRTSGRHDAMPMQMPMQQRIEAPSRSQRAPSSFEQPRSMPDQAPMRQYQAPSRMPSMDRGESGHRMMPAPSMPSGSHSTRPSIDTAPSPRSSGRR